MPEILGNLLAEKLLKRKIKMADLNYRSTCAIKRLEEKETLKSYQQEVTNRLSADCASISVEEEWQNIRYSILQAASTTIGRRKTSKKEWISSETYSEALLERWQN